MAKMWKMPFKWGCESNEKNSVTITYLSFVSHFDQSTDRVEGSCPTNQQMGLIVLLQHFDVVCTLRLLEEIQTLNTASKRVCV